MTNNSYMPADEVLSTASTILMDPGYHKTPKGVLLGILQRGLSKLALDTGFNELNYIAAIDGRQRIPIPPMIQVVRAYLFNGVNCDLGSAVPLHKKDDFNPGESGMVSSNKWDNRDNYFGDRSNITANPPDNLYYYNIQNGVLVLSTNSLGFDSVYLDYKGYGYKRRHGSILPADGAKIMVPEFAREALIDFVVCEGARMRLAHHPVMITLMNDARQRMASPIGDWTKAKMRAATMDKKERNDLYLYLTGFGKQA